MSVANSGVFKVVDAIQVELAELALSIPAVQDFTEIMYNWQFRWSGPNGGLIVPAGPLPAGVYAATGYVTISDTAFTRLLVQINGPGEETFSDYSTTSFVQGPRSINQYTMPVSFYFKVGQDLPSVFLDIASDMSAQGSITASVQIYKVNQAWPTPLAPA